MTRRRVFVVGATGAIGRATVEALVEAGHEAIAFVRRAPEPALAGAEVRVGDVTDPVSLADHGFCGERFDAVISCLASRTGAPDDAWAIDHRAQLNVLEAAKAAGVDRFVLVSAICVQRPKLAFQHAKLAFEAALVGSGLTYSIVRPTAFFRSLSGQVARVRRGKPFLMFGDGTLTACKPIADADLAAYLVGCLDDERRWNRILPIGGPGPAITPRDQAALLSALLGRPVRVSRVPVRMLDAIIGAFSTLGRIAPAFAAKAELARIGRYYATESMLVLDPASGRYDAATTPETGTRTLRDHYAALLATGGTVDLGTHAVFDRPRRGARHPAD